MRHQPDEHHRVPIAAQLVSPLGFSAALHAVILKLNTFSARTRTCTPTKDDATLRAPREQATVGEKVSLRSCVESTGAIQALIFNL